MLEDVDICLLESIVRGGYCERYCDIVKNIAKGGYCRGIVRGKYCER